MLVLRLYVVCFLLTSFVDIIFCDIVRDKDAPLCLGVQCKNGGTLDNETCACVCTEKMTGLLCDSEMLTSDWPKGTYGLPLSRYGCPETELHGWRIGYINMTVQDSLQSHSWGNSFYSKDLFLMGPFDSDHVQINFCIKNESPGQSNAWPRGSYCIYRVGGACAQGFDSGSVTMTGYQFYMSDTRGWLPDYSVMENKNDSVTTLQLYYCCRNDSQTKDEYFGFGVGWPFYIFKNDRDCPQQPGMLLTVEYFNFTTSGDGWQYSGVHPELTTHYNETNGSNVGMTFCYYSPPEDIMWKGETSRNNSAKVRLVPKWKPRIKHPQEQESRYIGCYNDMESRAMEGSAQNFTDLTTEMCISKCTKEGFLYAGTQHGKECFCGDSYDKYGPANAKYCRSKCNGNSEQICGGSWKLSVYRIGYDYVGCYIDKRDRAMNATMKIFNNLTTEMCLLGCRDEGFQYTGTQYSMECFCDDSYDRYGKASEDSDCFMTCSGAIYQTCGGMWRLSVYTTVPTPVSKPSTISWMQIDMEYLQKVVYVSYKGSTPVVFVSHQQWDFVHNGAAVCRGMELSEYDNQNTRNQSRLYCRRSLEARYVVILRNSSTPRFGDIHVVVHENRCSKQMGIGTGEINNYQLSISKQLSFTGSDSKVCVNATGGNSYIQVDLLVPMIVQGLEIRRHAYKSNLKIRIYYGVAADQMKIYREPSGNDVFEVQNAKNVFTKLWLTEEILATFLKIHIVELTADDCVELELIGCPRQVTKDIRCEHSSIHLGWARSSYIFSINNSAIKAKQISTGNFDKCTASCLYETPDCLAVIMSRDICKMYRIPLNRFPRIRMHHHFAIQGEKICIKDVQNTETCGDEINSPMVLESPMYPFYYGEDKTCRWHVVFPTSKRVKLEVSEINLTPEFSRNGQKCRDQLNVYDVTTTPGLSSKKEHKKSLTATHRYNVFYSTSNELRIELISCRRPSDTRRRTGRFALNIADTDMTGCGFFTGGKSILCEGERGILSTPSGLTSRSETYTWTISGSQSQFVELLFSGFYVSTRSSSNCRTSSINVYDLHMQRLYKPTKIGTYCNARPKYGYIKSTWNALQVEMITSSSQEFAGLVVTYEIKDEEFRNRSDEEVLIEQGGYDDWIIWKTHKYKFFQQNASLTQASAEQTCNKYGGHLLSIEDREEMQYINYLMVSVWKTLSPAIVGLYKHNTHASLNDFRWTNGIVATYFDWYSKHGQPDGHNFERCVSIQANSVWSTQTWSDYMCAYDGYRSFICELTAQSAALKLPQPPVINSLINDVGMFVCNDGTVIYVVLTCDGVDDCTDASDEANCEFTEHSAAVLQCTGQLCGHYINSCDFKTNCTAGSNTKQCGPCADHCFQCYDQKCIPNSRLADGFVDCSGTHNEDEKEMTVQLPPQYSCSAWYERGRKEDGAYLVNYGGKDSFEVECRFPTNTNETVKAIVHHDEEGARTIPGDRITITYKATTEQISSLKRTASCEQFVEVQCSWDDIHDYELLWNGSSENTFKWRKAYPDNKREMCDLEAMELFLTKPPYFRLSSKIYTSLRGIPLVEVRVARKTPRRSSRHAISVSPIICEEEMPNVVDDKMFCKKSIITERKHRCVLRLDKNGEVEGCRDMSHLQNCGEFECPETHVKCPNSFCIPRYMYCDGMKQCPDGSDEINCKNQNCSGLFKCRDSSVCIPMSEVCDGIKRCPYEDDELVCGLSCPTNCTCKNLMFTCSDLPDTSQISNRVRRLNISGTDLAGSHLQFSHLVHLGHLIITQANLQTLGNRTFKSLRNVVSLDLSNNQVQNIDEYSFSGLNNLLILNISQNKINNVSPESFSSVPNLRTLDMRGNDIKSFYSAMFDGMSQLEYLYTDEHRFCCVKPESVSTENCYPAADEFSSCKDLMKDETMRMCLWMIGSVALIGNGLSIIYRLGLDRASFKKAHGLFVFNLCLSDFLMGIYLYIIATADRYYRGRYFYVEKDWRHSAGCNAAGFLATLSSEVSTTMLCIITLDRVIAIKYPFSGFTFNAFRATVSLIGIWIVNIFISGLPLVGIPYFENQFYSKSGTCLALPLTRERLPAWEYSVTIFLGYNCLAFVVIVIGQVLIYMEIRSTNAISIRKSGQDTNIAVAKNLFLIVFTDFLCWFPIAVMGLFASFGFAIPAEMYAWTTVFILPINSALNPVLYTLNAYRQKQRNMCHRSEVTELVTQIDKLRNTRNQSLHVPDEKNTCNRSEVTEKVSQIDKRNTRNQSLHVQDEILSNLQKENESQRLEIEQLQIKIKEIDIKYEVQDDAPEADSTYM